MKISSEHSANERRHRERWMEIMRSTVIIVGILSFTLIFGIHRLTRRARSSILWMTIIIPSMLVGSSYGMLIIGLLLPWKGARNEAFWTFFINCYHLSSPCCCKQRFFYQKFFLFGVLFSFLSRKEKGARLYEPLASLLAMTYYVIDSEHTPHYYWTGMSANFISYLHYLPATITLTCLNDFILSSMFGFDDTNSISLELLHLRGISYQVENRWLTGVRWQVHHKFNWW